MHRDCVIWDLSTLLSIETYNRKSEQNKTFVQFCNIKNKQKLCIFVCTIQPRKYQFSKWVLFSY